MSSLKAPKVPIQSTAGAIPIRNEKGEVSMEKVKVARYVTGKRPDYAPQSSDEEDEDLEVQIKQKKQPLPQSRQEERRAVRLAERAAVAAAVAAESGSGDSTEEEDDDRSARVARIRRAPVVEPEILARSSEDDSETDEEEQMARKRRIQAMGESEEEEEEEELSEDEIERRRALIRHKAKTHKHEEEVMEVGEEKEGSAQSSSEYESEYESEEEDTGPRLKPVFVRKKDRITIQEKEKEDRRQMELQIEAKKMAEERRKQSLQAKKMAEERRKQSLQIVEESVRKEVEEQKTVDDQLLTVDTDDENDEEEYEAWKVRELRRMKRDKEEREAIEREKLETDVLRNMTEEERRKYAKEHPKEVTNQAKKGKYKFLQKYYHRGAFFIDQEEDVLKRDYSGATLEDHFDKTVLPKVMQVKNFGRSGRTKYTHLVDQDTTQFDAPWVADTAMNLKFQTTKGGGFKQVFDRPSSNKKNK